MHLKFYLARRNLVETLVGRVAALLPYHAVYILDARARAQQLLYEKLAHEAGGTRDQHVLVLVVVTY